MTVLAQTTSPAPAPADQQQPRPRRDDSTAGLWATPAAIAALSVLAGSTSLSAVVSGGQWVIPLIEVIGVIWMLGLGCRLLRCPAPLTVLVQFAGLIVALTGLFTTSGWGGFIPNGSVVNAAGELLAGAWQQILGTVPPAPGSVELSFLICLTIGTTALIVDFVVAEAKAPALVALPLLCLYSVPASIATDQLPWWSFAAPAAMYAILLAITGTIGVRTKGRKTTAGLLVTAVAITAVGTLVAVVGGDAVTGIGTEGKLPRQAAGKGSEIGLSPFTSLRGQLQKSDPAPLLRVTGLTSPQYLRTAGLEQWVPGDDAGFRPTKRTNDGAAVGSLPGVNPGAAPQQVQVTSQQFSDVFLPIYQRTFSVSGLADGWSFDRGLNMIFRERKLNPQTYTLQASFAVIEAAELRKDRVTATAALTATDDVPDEVRRRTQDITSTAATPFDKAEALRKFFTDPKNNFIYTLNPPRGTTGDPILDFLATKQGFCEQYATAMTAMLRTIGIPARVAVGFTQGERQADGSYLITTHNAHAWVEVLFDEHGWVQFDPTPLGSAGNLQGFDDPDSNGGGGGPAPTTTVSSGTTTNNSGTTIPRGGGLDADTQRIGDDGNDADTSNVAADAGGSESSGFGAVPAGLWWSLLALLAVVALAWAPRLARRLRTKRRMSVVTSGGAGAASVAWAEVEDLIVDHGMQLRPTESTRTTANRLAKSSRLTENARNRLRALVLAAEQEWYAAGTAKVGADRGAELVAAVAAVGNSLDQSSPRAFLDRWVPRSLRPSSRD